MIEAETNARATKLHTFVYKVEKTITTWLPHHNSEQILEVMSQIVVVVLDTSYYGIC